ncbi:TonB-dependent receptor [Dokdonia ponticola]|uniref:TonB-dependent receptor n=1 Tax=Dokdonia ponticola TaxID=2041041 RepID=A0ABV9HYD7_9FLAO
MMKTNRLHCIIICICLSLSFQSFSQNTTQKGPYLPEIPHYLQVPQIDSLTAMREHIVLQLANEQISNDQLFFKAYLLTGPLQNRYSNSTVLHIELQDNEGAIIKKQFHKIDNGMVTGNIKLPKRTKKGAYTVKAYTQWMKNFSDIAFTQKQIQIGPSTDTQTATENRVTITPEGGAFLQQYKNKIAFQIPSQLVSKDGFIGTITDAQGKAITKVKAYAPGVGIAFVEPEENIRYFLKLEDNTSYPFPESQDEGYLIQINNIEPSVANIQVIRSEKSVKTPLKLIGTLRGIPYFEKNVSFSNNSAIIKLDKEKIPKGMLELQLIDQEGAQLVNRPIWIDGSPLQITWNQITSTSEEMVYKIKVTDQNNKPVKTQVALSVIQEESTPMAFENTDLLNTLESQSDPTINDRNRRFLQDMYVLTSSKNNTYSTEKTIKDQEKVIFPIQKGLEITGYAYDLNNSLLENTIIQVMFTNQDEVRIEEATTDKDGILRLKNLQINGETNIVFRTQGEDTKSRLVTLEPIQEFMQNSIKTVEKAKKTIIESEAKINTRTQKPFDTEGSELLEEVALSGRKTKKEEKPSLYGVKPPNSRIKYQDPERPRSIAQMLSELPGVQVSGVGDLNEAQFITITSSSGGPVLYVIDGIPLYQDNNRRIGGVLSGPSTSRLRPLVDMVSSSDVERIELLVGTDAAMYGARGAGGVIVVYTRFASGENISRKKAQLDFQGYEPAISFEEYQKSLSKREQKNDPVVYWNPSVETDENGEAIIKLPISSENMPLKVKATTINKKGDIGVLHTLIK